MPVGVTHATQSRWMLLVVAFCCFWILSSQRMNMTIAVLCMVDWNKITTANICLAIDETITVSEVGEFKWTVTTQCQILVSYFYGLILMHLPAELLVEKFKPEYIALIGMILSSVSSLVTPVASKFHIVALVFAQIFKAMGHATLQPAFSAIFCQCVAAKDLVRFMAYASCGIYIGSFFTVILTGITCNNANPSWPFIFHFTGATGIVWLLFWLYLCVDSQFLPVLRVRSGNPDIQVLKEGLQIPYAKIFSSKAFWGYVCCGVATYWILAMNMFVMPLYYRNVFNELIEWNALLVSFPNVLQAFLYVISFVILKKKFAEKTIRRQTVACFGILIFSTCMVLLSFVRCSKALGVLLMSIGVGVSGCNFAVITLIAADMSPNFAGVLSGIMNTIGAIAGCFLPYMVGWFTDMEDAFVRDWEKIFYASFFVPFVSMILFMAYSSCEIQLWNKPEIPIETSPHLPFLLSDMELSEGTLESSLSLSETQDVNARSTKEDKF